MRRYEAIVIEADDVRVRTFESPEYVDPGDEVAVDGAVVVVYRVELLPGGRGERLICLPPTADDPRIRVAA